MPSCRRVRKAQPNTPIGVDWSNPLAKNLWALVVIGQGGLVEMVRRRPFGKTGSPVVKVGRNGLAANATGAADNFFLTGLPAIPVDSGLTISILSEVDAQNGTRKRAIRLAGSAGTIATIDYGDGASQDYLFGVQKAGGSFAYQHGTVAPYPLGPKLLTLVQGPGAASTLGYENAVLQTGSALPVSGNFASTIDSIYLANSGSGFPLNGKLYFAAIWTRALSAMDVKALSENPWQLFKGRRNFLPAIATVQVARPVADLSNTGWVPSSGATLYPMIGETIRDDGTYISATAVGALCEVDLTDLSDPAVSTGHLPTLVLSAPGGGGITIRLRQGTTTIATWTYHPGATPTEYTPALSGAEADSITDYTALRLQFEAIA